MKRIRIFSALLALCFIFLSFPASAMAGDYFPAFDPEKLEYDDPTEEENKLYDEIVSIMNGIKEGSKYSSKVIKSIDAKISRIKTSWLKSQAKYCKAIALYQYGKYKEAIKIWKDLLKVWRKDKSWDLLADSYVWIGTAYSWAGDMKEAKKAFSAALSVEKEAGLALSPAMKREINARIATVEALSKETSSTKTADDYAEKMLQHTNDERAKVGAPALVLDDTLCKAANIRALESVESFSHTRPDGRSYSTVFSEVGLKPTYSSENLARKEPKTPEAAVKGWMKSEGHKKNLLNPKAKKLGVGLAYDSKGRPYWVQLFTS